MLAARKLKDRLRRVGAALMGVNYEDVVYENGYVRDVKTGKSLSIKDIANALTTNVGGTWPYGVEPSLEDTAYFGLSDYTYPYGSHIALVEVTEEGLVKVLDYVAIDDIGMVVNPMLAEGQVLVVLSRALARLPLRKLSMIVMVIH